MNERKRVILCGDTILLAGVQATLGTAPNLQVIPFDQPLDALEDCLGELRPAVVIFDLAAIEPDLFRSLLQQPGLLLIGIDPDTDEALVWSARQQVAVAGADLVDLIGEEGKSGVREAFQAGPSVVTTMDSVAGDPEK